MSMIPPAAEQELLINSDTSAMRAALGRIRDAHSEVSLSDLDDEDDEPVVHHERRRSSRAKMQLPVIITPADWSPDSDDAVVVSGDEQIGVTRDISTGGIGVTHDHLINSEAAIVTFDLPGEGPISFVLDLRWSVRQARFSFMSGGSVVGILDSK